MKLVICVLLSLVALARADSSYQSYQNNYENNYPSYYEETSGAPNYYQGAQRRQSFFDSVRDIFIPSVRRQLGLGGLLGLIGPFLGILVVITIVVVGIAVASSGVTSSGRGLDTDEWEVDHSVWMNQLQKDFEDSWSTE